MCVIAGELAVEVDASVERILEPVQPGAVGHVVRRARDLERVVLFQARQLQAPAVKSARRQLFAVEHCSRDGRPDELDESVRARPAASEGHRRVRAERRVALREVEGDVVVDVGDQRGTVLRLAAREVIAKDDEFLLAALGAQQQWR